MTNPPHRDDRGWSSGDAQSSLRRSAALRVEPVALSQSKTAAAIARSGDRPSQHGALLGQALARIAAAGRRKLAEELPEPCLTCAFREGTMPNQCAGTGKVALDCLLQADKFGCHHGMKNGDPTKLCVGYVAALAAPFRVVRAVLGQMYATLSDIPENDPVRAEFDAWAQRLDPEAKLDVYQLGRAYAQKGSS